VEAGEEVIIARAGRPVARLAPMEPHAAAGAPESAAGLPAWMGSLRGRIHMAADIDEDWAGLTRVMEDGAVWPPDRDEA
jgi:antitoxin (DNA-binding transcriptional repressor) of toxin-antitoxin stability system